MLKHISKILKWLLSHAITVFSCVAIIVLGMGAVAYSSTSTTIGNNISTGGTLTVLSNSNLATTTISGGNLIVDTNTLIVDKDNHLVGIGTTTPAHKLDVYGDLRVGIIGSAYDNTLYANTTNGRVGIGTTSPYEKLSVAGNIVADGTITAGENISTNGTLTVLSNSSFGGDVTTNGSLHFASSKNIILSVEGDSISEQPLDQNGRLNWPYQSVNWSEIFGRGKLYNWSVGDDVVSNMVTEYATQAHSVRPSGSDQGYFFLMGGTNDVSSSIAAATIYNNLKTIWAFAKTDGYKVIVFTVLPKDGWTVGNGKETIRLALNALILSDPTLYDAVIRSDLLLPDPTNITYFLDGIHPSPAGSAIIASAVATALSGLDVTEGGYLRFGTGYAGIIGPGSINGNPIKFLINSVEKMNIDTAGNVGMGVITPLYKLDVAGFINTDQYSGYNQAGNTILYASSTNKSILVGQSAGSALISDGNYNTAIGYEALKFATSSDSNTAVGFHSLYFNTTGYQNTSSGMNSLLGNTTGYNNTANGMNSLLGNTTGYNNTANGMSALLNNTTGYNNTANGMSVLFNNTEGYGNTANGYFSLYHNTTGNYNTASGISSLLSNTIGQFNTATGMNSLSGNTEGNNNTSYGVYSLTSNSTGSNNTANGYAALNTNSVGSENTANGMNSLYTNSIGWGNVANGYDALWKNTEGHNNTANGEYSLLFNTTGSFNTADGSSALHSHTTGDNNTAIGASALFDNSTGSGNVAIGFNAGAHELGSNSFYVDNKDRTDTNGDKTKALMYGTFAAAATNQLLTINANVGIGTTTPATTLDVNGIIKTQPRSTATCNTNSAGGIYFDSDDNHFYGCNGTAWVQLDN